MKKTLTLLLCLLIAAGCSVQKRRYQKGFYMARTTSAKSSKETATTATAAKEAEKKHHSNQPSDAEQVTERLHFLAAAAAEHKPAAPQPETGQPAERTAKSPEQIKDEPCDELVFKDGTEVKGRVIEITPTEIKYKKCDMPDGPMYVTKKSQVFMVKYANGTREVFKEEVAPAPLPAKTASASKAPAYKKTHPLGIASFVLGLLGFVPYLGLVTSILAIVLGSMAIERSEAQPDVYDNPILGRIGKIIGIVIVSLYALALILFLLFLVLLF